MNDHSNPPRSIHGVILPLGPEDVSPVIWDALVSGSYEAKEARQVARIIHEGDRILELGAGIGVVTAVMARIPGVRIWAFDANPHTVALARRVAEANGITNASFEQAMITTGAPQTFTFYLRRDFWMSSTIEEQGPYEGTIEIASRNLEAFVAEHDVNVLVMDIEGAERWLLGDAPLDGIERVFLELHDHLYGLTGLREIFAAMAAKGFGYDPRGSSGPCVLFTRDDGTPRSYCADVWA